MNLSYTSSDYTPISLLNSSGFELSSIKQERQKQRDYNRKRGYSFSSKVKQNQIMREALNKWWLSDEADLTLEEQYYFSRFRKNLSTCCHNSLFRQHSNNEHEFIGAHTCNHKYCCVCNAERSKKTRRAYRRFFEAYPELLSQFDFMHLTLTVPHDKNGWRGKKFYADELMKEFNFMRKKKFWKQIVYAGEFGVELTKHENGFHIHIHSMILVRKTSQNRNLLHKKILLAWNKQTAQDGDFEPLSKDRIDSIVKSNKKITDLECLKLNATGATLIGLESLYIKSDIKKDGFIKCKRTGVYKRYVKAGDDFDKFMSGVMECIKYHFEPMAMKKDGDIDFDLMREILPMIAGKPLYRKFGAFHGGTKNAHEGAKLLNFNNNSIQEELLETVDQVAKDEVYNPKTLEVVKPNTYTYIVVPMSCVYFDPGDNYKPKIPEVPKRHLNTSNIRDAMIRMLEKSIAESMIYGKSKAVA